jgi:hypothetical protein
MVNIFSWFILFQQKLFQLPATVLIDIRTTDVGVAIFSLTLLKRIKKKHSNIHPKTKQQEQ